MKTSVKTKICQLNINNTNPLRFILHKIRNLWAVYILLILASTLSACSGSGTNASGSPVTNSSKAISTYSINNVSGIINGQNISVILPVGTEVTNLVASFTTTGANLSVGTPPIEQVSGSTANNFTSPLVYTVTAADGSEANYTVVVTVASMTDKTIAAYSINGVVGVISGQNIVVTLPYGSNDVTALIATFIITGANATVGSPPITQVSGSTPNNFTESLVYTITAGDGSAQSYNVSVIVASASAKALTSYSINGVPGVITGSTIALVLPFGTNLTNLIATYTTTGTTVTIGNTAQISMITPNDFTSPIVYTVTAGDNSTATYNVTVTTASNSANSIATYSLDGVPGVIIGSTIAITLPFGTNLTNLVATFISTGVGITVAGVPQVNMVTPNDFTLPVIYTVIADDGSTATYSVVVTLASNTAKSITSYSLDGSLGVITGSTIAVTVPSDTNLTNLIATFISTGTSVTIGSTTQINMITPNDFTASVIYTVTAGDGSTANYTVIVTVASSTAKAITSYSLNSTPGIIDGSNISVTLPYGTNVTNLMATFISSGTSVNVGSTQQISTITPNNFTSPVIYTVTAADNSTATYTVSVTIASNTAKAITSYSLNGIVGVITESNIAVIVPYNTNITNLVATFTNTGTGLTIGSTTQINTITANNFTSPVIYTVTAADNSTSTYTVTVIIASNTAKAITAYSINGSDGVINGESISVSLPYGSSVTSLVASFTTTGSSVSVGPTLQVSTATVNNFTLPVTYTVTAADSSTDSYSVTVTIASNTAKAITAYSINGRNGVISGESISVSLPYGSSVTSLIATFTTTGTSVSVGSTLQVSTATVNNFTLPVTYTVTAADSSTTNYSVKVTVSSIPAALHLFVTNQTSTGNLLAAANVAGGAVTNGVAGADYLCQVDSQCSTGSICKAMLVSLGIESPMREASPTLVDWVLQANTTYYNMSEAPIGTTNGTSTFTFPLTNTIGNVGANPLVWTGMNGTPPTTPWTSYAFTCNDWTMLSSTATAVGETDILNYLSISTFGPNCSTPYALYCAQQANALILYAGIVAAPGIPISGAVATASNLSGPQGVAVDSNNNLYIADTTNSLIEKVSPSGIITIIAGGGSVAPSLSTAAHDAFIPTGGAKLGTFYTLSSPKGVAVDNNGNVYIADTTDQFIERIDATTGILSIIAGSGSSGAANGTGAATSSPLNLPQGVAVDSLGTTIYIADTGNSRIEKVTAGNISYFAGTGTLGTPIVGAANLSPLNFPHGVAVSSNGNVYIADTSNNVVEIVTGGNLSIFAGTGTAGLPSVGAATLSKLSAPNSVAIANNGNIYIADTTNNVIEQVTNGILSIFAGSPGSAGAPTVGPAASSLLSSPHGVAVYGSGSVYIADTANNVVEKIN